MTSDFTGEYAPYNTMKAFQLGMTDYAAGIVRPMTGVEAQAYDRGMECAMRMTRADRWIDENVGLN